MVSLSPYTWFRTGGNAEVLFSPRDAGDLREFLAHIPHDVGITVLGTGSNILVRDAGISGVVIRLGSGFRGAYHHGDGKLEFGASLLDSYVADFAAKCGISGLEFMACIPGTIGGAVRMNSGCYHSEISNIFAGARTFDTQGNEQFLTVEDMHFGYRQTKLDKQRIFLSVIFQGKLGQESVIREKMVSFMQSKQNTQPLREKTGGSTFKNPCILDTEHRLSGCKAWELIDMAGCRGLRIGRVQMSERHCNFMINLGGAFSKDLEILGLEVQRRVFETCGILLEWEILRLGIEYKENCVQ
jgi:UDP-N-acetylmuramate dehydrogenase